VAAVERLGVDAVQVAHASGQVGFGRGDDEVVVVGQQAVGVAAPMPAPDRVAKQVEEAAAVVVVEEDRRAGVAAGGDVVEGVVEFEAERASHAAWLRPVVLERKT
jgi:hypothetical protein